jgi:MFS transporter, putative metabolite:H+ symporter
MEKSVDKKIVLTILVAALGYFVDIYDLLLFGIVRQSSLKDVGIAPDALLKSGLLLLNFQMAGMLVGGVLWGILGDKRGRKSVLFGSIFLYSIANILNAFVINIETYSVLRFVAGVGLAGELGIAITLVSEVMDKKNRGFGTAIVAGVGILGAVFASLVGDFFDWKTAYIIGGSMGLVLLTLRAGLLESSMFDQMKNKNISKGNFHKIFTDRKRLFRYVSCIAIGIPIWFVIGILITFAPELSAELGVTGVTASKSIMWSYLGLSIGDISAGVLSQLIKSRKKTVFIFLVLTTFLVVYYIFCRNLSLEQFYLLCSLLGFATGYWAVFVTIAAEQFGTNLRATVATTTPNFVRGSVILITLSFQYLKPEYGILNSALSVGLFCLGLAFISLFLLHETYGKDLDYVETI